MSRKGKVVLFSPNMIRREDGINRIQPGMGIAFLAAVLRRRGHEVFVRDTALEGYENKQKTEHPQMIQIGEADEQIKDYIESVKPDVVGISITFSNMSKSAQNIAKITKEINPEIYVVIGGNHVTNTISDYSYATQKGLINSVFYKSFEQEIGNKNIDYAMYGESDYTFTELVDCLLDSRSLGHIQNVIYKDKNDMLPPPPPER